MFNVQWRLHSILFQGPSKDADENWAVDVDDEEDDLQLQKALARTRRLKQRVAAAATGEGEEDVADKVLKLTSEMPAELEPSSGAEFIGTFSDDKKSNIILNETSEFCRHLGAWQTSNALSGGGANPANAVSKEILDFEDSLTTVSKLSSVSGAGTGSGAGPSRSGRSGGWEEVHEVSDSDSDGGADDDDITGRHGGPKTGKVQKTNTILDEEPNLMSGVAAAIQLAANKGYWDSKVEKTGASKLQHLQAQNYSIEDKVHGSDDHHRHGRRGDRGDRGGGGPTVPFQEKSGFVPNVKLQYIDDSGRLLNSKEAFRYLSHKFHGKGSGKMKTEKRMKKVMEDSMMKNMSSTDTPLNTLERLKERQRETANPYVVLTGKKKAADIADIRK